jgi:23S rRNA (adenine2030-N6)-methyltransferase
VNYKHVYHAGSFTDVVKHVVLAALITSLKRKETPLCCIDTHAGTGVYDLFSEFAKKTHEYETGIEKIIQHNAPPLLIKQYIDCVHRINNRLTGTTFSSLRYYPGSPMIARHFARATDRIIACELHPEEYQTLRNTFAGDNQVSVHHMDGFLGLKAFLPPKERRGIVLIDPPYEDPDEFTHLTQALPAALKRWESGVYAIWYPIKEKRQIERFYAALKQHLSQDILAIELNIYPDIPNHLNGCGMAVINPPWQFDGIINNNLPWLWNALTINQQGGFRSFLLK